MNMMAQWEDETSNRQVQFSIQFTVENGTVGIESVTPTKVTFIDQVSNTILRTIGVHTEKGRTMLADQFAQSGKLQEFTEEVARREGLLVAV